MAPTKLKLSCHDSFWQFGLMSLGPNAHRCVVGFRASFLSTVSSCSQHLTAIYPKAAPVTDIIALRAWSCMWWCICQNFSSHGSCLFHQPLKKLEHCGICPRPRSHLRQVYFVRYCLIFSNSCKVQKNRVDHRIFPHRFMATSNPRFFTGVGGRGGSPYIQ